MNKSLTIYDVDCERCKKTLTYFRLMPEAQSRINGQNPSLSNQDEPPPQASQLESKTPAGSEPKDGRDLFGRKPGVRPKLTFDSREEIRCVFLTLIVKAGSLRKKYKKGVRAFLERYGARCNRNLAYLFAMGGEDFDEPVMDLERSGLTHGDDFVCFDAAMRLLSITMMKEFDKTVSEEVTFPVDWLRGRIHKGNMLVSFAEKTQEAKKL